MEPVTVGFLGGPHDGRLQAFQTDDAGRPPPVLEAIELTSSVDMYRTLVEGDPAPVPPLSRTVAYRLVVSHLETGPRWLYVHPSVTLPKVD